MNIKDSYIHNGTAVLKDIKVESSVLKKILAGKDANDAYLDWETVCDLTGIKPTAAGTADKVGHKLTFSGGVTGDWDGSDAKTVAIPTKSSWNYDDVYLALAGGLMTGTIRRYYNADNGTPMIQLLANNKDAWLWRISHATANTSNPTNASTGFGLKYLGSLDGDNNKLALYADAQTDTQVLVADVTQSGIVKFTNNISINGNTNYHSGNLGIATLMGSNAIGDSDEPVYWSGSAFIKAGAYPTKASWNYDDVYLKLTGNGTTNPMTGTIYMDNIDGLIINSHNKDLNIWEIYGNGGAWASQYGFNLQYLGTGDGNDNDLILWAHAQSAATHVEVYRVHQDGSFIFKAVPKVGTNTVYHAGNLTIKTLMGTTAIGDADEPVYWSGTAFVKAGAYPTKSSWNYDDVYLKLSGGTLTGDLTIKSNSGDSPKLIFQRGTLTDSLDDWRIFDTGGNLKFQHTTGSTTDWKDYIIFSATAGTLTINGNTALHSGNYTSYTVEKDGTGATGTWGIDISGNAATATTATNLSAKPSIQAGTSDTSKVTITAGGKTSDEYIIPAATKLYSYTIAASTDLNTIKEFKYYTSSATATCSSLANGPDERSNGEMWFLALPAGSTNYGQQLYYSRASTNWQLWTRTWANTSFSTWVQFIHSGNIGSQSVNYATSSGKVDHKLTFTGGVTGDWDGSANKTVAIPTKASWNYDDAYPKKYYYALPPQKCIKIKYEDLCPVWISAGRHNGSGQFLLAGLGYGEKGWIRNQFRCLIPSTYFKWKLSNEGRTVELYHNATLDNDDAIIYVITTGTITFTETSALSGNEDTKRFACYDELPTKSSWNYDDVYLKDLLLDTGNSTDKDKSVSLTDGNVYLKLFKTVNGAEAEDSKVKIYGDTNISVTTDASGDIKITGVDSVSTATTATNLANAPTINIGTDTNINKISITAGEKTSTYITVPYSTAASNLNYHTQITNGADLDAFHEVAKFKICTWNNFNEENRALPSYPGISNGIILDGGWASAGYGFQLAIDDDPTWWLALRQKGTSGWSAWKKIPMGDGTNASGTWSIGITGNAGSATYASNVGAAGTAGTDYVTAANVISMYNWYNAITATDEASNTAIDKWQEILDFLSGVTDTSTLSGILAGYAASNHDHDDKYLKLTGGTLSGTLSVSNSNSKVVVANTSYDTSISLYASQNVGIWNEKTQAWILKYSGGSLYSGSNLIWHEGNDGASSGLDADLLDGHHASYFSIDGHTHNYLYSTQASSAQNNVTWAIGQADTTRRGFIYNTNGTEWSYLFGLSTSNTVHNEVNKATYGVILKMGYTDTYLRMLRVSGAKWFKTDGTQASVGSVEGVDWEKISAGYADKAGTITVNNSNSDSTYRMVWHSGTTLYSTDNIYCNPNKDWLYSNGLVSEAVGKDSYIAYPQGGNYVSGADSVKGALAIYLPTAAFHCCTMLKFTVDIYNYYTGTSCTYVIAGYNYDSPVRWYNVSAYAVRQGTSALGNLSVRFGNNGSREVIWIGEAVTDSNTGLTQTSWTYPQVTVRDVTLGFNNYGYDKWATGWAIDFVTAFDTVQSTITDPAVNYVAATAPWSGITSKPETATRWPSWSEVTDKPAIWDITSKSATSYNLSRDSWTDTINLPTDAGSYILCLITGNSTLTGVFSIGSSDTAKDEISLHLHGNGVRLYARTNNGKLQLSSNYTPTQANPTQSTSVVIKYKRMI